MIDKYNKQQCNGCKMCKDLCPKDAITYEVDDFGFWYPKVNYDKCIQCGLCVKKCPNQNPIKCRTRQPEVLAAWSVDDQVRLDSTSGGVFYELAKYTLEQNGYVVGCVYDDDFKGAHQVIIESMDELYPLMVSKYLQSDTEDIYYKTKEKLMTGSPVLFVGAPCHAAALVSYLGREYDNLIICDFLCRGANSPKAHRKYVECLENKYGATITHIRSKDKRYGWNNFGQAAIFSNGKEYYGSRSEDLRIVAYHHGNLMMRDSCHDCQFKHIPRDGADITLADFWSISAGEVENIEKGISLVFINTEKGKETFDNLTGRVKRVEKTLEDALKGNPAIYTSAIKGKNRDAFLSELDTMPFEELVNKYRNPEPSKFRKVIGRVKRKIKNIVKRMVQK